MAVPAVSHIDRIGTALPPTDVHEAFVDFVGTLLTDRRDKAIFRRLVGRAAIDHRWSFVTPVADGLQVLVVLAPARSDLRECMLPDAAPANSRGPV